MAELIALVRERYPTAAFVVEAGEDDSEATHITATVDVDDPDEVTDLVIEGPPEGLRVIVVR